MTNTLPAVTDDMIEADENSALSDYDTETGMSSTQSLSSSILETEFANGRKYHRKSAGQYFMPADEAELNRLDLVHHMCLQLLDGELHTAPLQDLPLHNVLDCGTGTGIWALDFGETHPQTQVLGVDLAPTQPQWVYPNVRFETDDLEKEWLWKDKFDFIHARTLSVAIRDWPRFARQMFKQTTPGGWVEVVDHPLKTLCCDDNSAPKDSKMTVYMEKLSESLKAAGVNSDLDQHFIKKVLEDAGFQDIRVTIKKMPSGVWPQDKKLKRVGRIVAECLVTGFEAYGIAAMVATGISPKEAQKICDDALQVVREGKEHWYNIIFHVAGRKPEDA